MHLKRTYFKILLILTFVAGLSICNVSAQQSIIGLHFVKTKAKKADIRFELLHNLIVVPVFINGSDTMRFILDTGVSHTMITSLTGVPGLSFNFAREIKLYGLGREEEIEAYHSFGNMIELPGVMGFNHNIIILKEEFDFLSSSLGVQIHGLTGYDMFDNFIVEIDYRSKKLTLYDRTYFHERRREKRLKKARVLNIEVIRRKPYTTARIIDNDNNAMDVNLLVDTGASHALSLFRSMDDRIVIPEKNLYTYIGQGLGGEIYGYIARVKRFELDGFRLKKPVVTYPDLTSIMISDTKNERSGSIGADILKRFTVILDYHRNEMLLAPNAYYKSDFRYNLSGMDVATPVPGLHIYKVVKVRRESPAWIAGIEEGDQIITLNGIDVAELSLGYIVRILQSKPGRRVHIGIMRNGQTRLAKFTLEDPLK